MDTPRRSPNTRKTVNSIMRMIRKGQGTYTYLRTSEAEYPIRIIKARKCQRHEDAVEVQSLATGMWHVILLNDEIFEA